MNQGADDDFKAILEGAVFVIIAIVLGLAHVWNYDCHEIRKTEAEDALRFESIRQKAVQQLKSEHRMWSVTGQGHWHLKQVAIGGSLWQVCSDGAVVHG